MSPPAAEADLVNESELPADLAFTKNAPSSNQYPVPLVYSGSLDDYEHFDVTAVIGREYPGAQLSEILQDDAKIRDLAITGNRSYMHA